MERGRDWSGKWWQQLLHFNNGAKSNNHVRGVTVASLPGIGQQGAEAGGGVE